MTFHVFGVVVWVDGDVVATHLELVLAGLRGRSRVEEIDGENLSSVSIIFQVTNRSCGPIAILILHRRILHRGRAKIPNRHLHPSHEQTINSTRGINSPS